MRPEPELLSDRASALPIVWLVAFGMFSVPALAQPSEPSEPQAPPAAEQAPPAAEQAPPAAPAEAAEAGPSASQAASVAGPQTGPETGPETEPVAPTEAQQATAREAYGRGQAAFKAGDYAAAEGAFQAAFAAVPNPTVLLALAHTAARLGRVPDAIDRLTRYLDLAPDAANRDALETQLTKLKETSAILAIASPTPGLVVTIDGQPLEGGLPQALELPPGVHELVASAEGYVTQTESLQAEPGVRHEWDVRLEPLPPPPVAAVDPEPASIEPPSEDTTAALWVTGVVGASGILAGSVLGFLALAENSDFDQNPTTASADRGERLALFADLAFGVGAMALVTGAVLYLTQGDDEPDAEQAGGSLDSLQVGAYATPDGAFLMTQGRY